MNFRSFVFFLWIMHHCSPLWALEPCRCAAIPFDSLSPERYDIIFCGIVLRTQKLNENLNTVVFSVKELYKGNVTSEWQVHYDPEDPCAIAFQSGEEWMMFLNYYQHNNSKLNWCSHSRKFFKNKMDDPYRLVSGWEYDEVKFFLNKNLGLKKTLSYPIEISKGRNLLPERYQLFLYLLISSLALFIIYFFIRKKK